MYFYCNVFTTIYVSLWTVYNGSPLPIYARTMVYFSFQYLLWFTFPMFTMVCIFHLNGLLSWSVFTMTYFSSWLLVWPRSLPVASVSVPASLPRKTTIHSNTPSDHPQGKHWSPKNKDGVNMEFHSNILEILNMNRIPNRIQIFSGFKFN